MKKLEILNLTRVQKAWLSPYELEEFNNNALLPDWFFILTSEQESALNDTDFNRYYKQGIVPAEIVKNLIPEIENSDYYLHPVLKEEELTSVIKGEKAVVMTVYKNDKQPKNKILSIFDQMNEEKIVEEKKAEVKEKLIFASLQMAWKFGKPILKPMLKSMATGTLKTFFDAWMLYEFLKYFGIIHLIK